MWYKADPDTIAVAVGMGDDQGDRLPMMPRRPFGDDLIDRRSNLQPAGARVDQERAIAAENQIEAGPLEVRADRLADHIRVVVLALRLHPRLIRPNAVDPRLEQRRRRRDCGVAGGARK